MKPKSKRSRMPREVTLVLDVKTAKRLAIFDKCARLVDAQKTAQGRKKWTQLEMNNTILWLIGEATTAIGEDIVRLYLKQYPIDKYVR